MSSPGTRLHELPQDALIAILLQLSAREWGSLARTCKALNQLVQDDSLWHHLALAKWGPCVNSLAAPRVQAGQWKVFCQRRLPCTPPPPRSPIDLVQERFPDPWSNMACCLLCSRTSGGPTIRNALLNFLLHWPSPSALLSGDEDAMLAALHPLGMQAMRLKALRNMSRDFLATDWEDPSEFNGCGPFVSQSWRVFCRGLRDPKQVTDVSLSRYVHWLLRGEVQAKGGRKGRGANPAAGSEEEQEVQRKRKRQEEQAKDAARKLAAAAAAAAPGQRVTRGMSAQVAKGGGAAGGGKGCKRRGAAEACDATGNGGVVSKARSTRARRG